MKNNSELNKLIEDTINSMNGAERATPKPFLTTRINQHLLNLTRSLSFWDRISYLLTRPVIVIPALLVVIFLNILIITTSSNSIIKEQNINEPGFSVATSTFYDLDNLEP